MDADVPCDLLLVLGAVFTVSAFIEAGATMAFHVMVIHQLVVATKVTEHAFEWRFSTYRGFVSLQIVAH